MGVELGQEAELGLLAFLAGGAAGEIGAHDRHLSRWRVKAQLYIPALGVKFGRVVAHHHFRRFVARVDTHA